MKLFRIENHQHLRIVQALNWSHENVKLFFSFIALSGSLGNVIL